jgi:hypothetical protein
VLLTPASLAAHVEKECAQEMEIQQMMTPRQSTAVIAVGLEEDTHAAWPMVAEEEAPVEVVAVAASMVKTTVEAVHQVEVEAEVATLVGVVDQDLVVASNKMSTDAADDPFPHAIAYIIP